MFPFMFSIFPAHTYGLIVPHILFYEKHLIIKCFLKPENIRPLVPEHIDRRRASVLP